MATVYAGTGDSWVRNTSASSWAAAQGDATTTGTSQNSGMSSYNFTIYNAYSGGRGGNTYFCSRGFFPFDVSGESGTVDSATLSLYADYFNTGGMAGGNVVGIESTALADNTSDFGNCYSSGTTFGTKLIDATLISQTAEFQSLTLNSAGITALNSAIGSATITIGIIGNYYDYLGNSPSLGGVYTKIRTDFANGSNDAYLTITYATAAVTDNATFFGANF